MIKLIKIHEFLIKCDSDVLFTKIQFQNSLVILQSSKVCFRFSWCL